MLGKMNVEEAARRVHLGRSILFTGAGFSFGAESISRKPLTDAAGLAAALSAEIGEPAPLPLDLAADEYIAKTGNVGKIIELLKQTFFVSSFKDFHSEICHLPWRRIYTTNYDNLPEECLRRTGKLTLSATLHDAPVDGLKLGAIIHLNGFVERIAVATWEKEVILTTSDYLTDKVRQSPWAEAFRSDLSLADSIFFMGYSLYDLDVARILYENPDIIRKTFFVIGKTPDRATVLKAGRLGTVIQENVSDIAHMFPAAGSAEAAKPSPFTVVLSRSHFTPATAAPKTDDVKNFLTKGDVNESYLARGVIEGLSDYYISREDIHGIVDIIRRGKGRILIHSDLGNGKSSSLTEISVLLQVAGFDTYNFSGALEGVEHDYSYLSALPLEEQKKVVVIIEDGFVFSSFVKDMTRNFPEIGVVVTARSAAVETRLGSVKEAFGDDYQKVDLNLITKDESRKLSSLLLQHGLWGERQGLSDEKRLKFIWVTCKGHLGTVLLSVCRSSQIFQRLKEELRNLDEFGPAIIESLIAALALAYAGQAVRISQLCEIVQADLFKSSRAQGNTILREFVEFENNRVTVKSPAFAQAVLADLISDHILVEYIPRLIARLDYLSANNTFYRNPEKKMMRFGFIERILNDQDKGGKLVNFYENIRATGVGVQNPQFWLQYAIARMSFKDYQGAEGNFDSAFGLVDRRRSYDPFQIENHFARFLLESRSETTHWADYYEASQKAHGILREQMRRYEEGHYPYKVASNYLSFIEARHSEFSDDQLDQFSQWCAELLAIAAVAPADVQRTGYWKNFNAIINTTIDLISDIKTG